MHVSSAGGDILSHDFLAQYGTEDHQSIDIQNQPLIKNKPYHAAYWVANTILFLGSSGVILGECLHGKDIKLLSGFAFLNGISIATFFKLGVPSEFRKQFNTIANAWVYELIYGSSQLELNLALKKEMKIYGIPFIWLLGRLLGKDIFSLLSLKKGDMPLRDFLPADQEPIKTVGFHTRDQSFGAYAWLAAMGTSAVALTIFNFIMVGSFETYGDIGKIGLIQIGCALYGGSHAGDGLARLLDNWRERLEVASRQETAPLLKVLTSTKGLYELFAPFLTAGCLGIPTKPNGVGDFIKYFVVGAFYGSYLLVARRRFENGPVVVEVTKPSLELVSTKEKVVACFKKYGATVCAFGALFAYGGATIATNTMRADWGMIILMSASFFTFLSTNFLISKHNPQLDNRIINEISFRTIYASFASCLYFLVLDSLLNISDTNLNNDSNTLYGFELLTWLFLAANMGMNRAINLNERGTLPITPSFAEQVLMKRFIENLT